MTEALVLLSSRHSLLANDLQGRDVTFCAGVTCPTPSG
jgi:hypothetical protein